METAETTQGPFPICDILGMSVACIDRVGVLDHLFGSLARGAGGWLVTANLDFLRRHAHDPEAAKLYARADVCVADGMPLVWAARLQGDRLPERVAGSDLLLLVSERAEREQRSIYLLGGEPTANARAVDWLRGRFPALRIAGNSSPRVSNPPTPAELAAMREELVRGKPDIVLVGMGSPKQELIIDGLRDALPGAWWIGVGISFSFVAGSVRRAPMWMRKIGLEWFYRFLQEPRRLARRYFLEDFPFFFELVARSLLARARPRRAALK